LDDPELMAALGRLSAGDREALLLCYWEELEPGQMARALGCSRAAAAVRLHRARRRLARELELEGATVLDAEERRACVERTESL
jgi:RNA polymerase sigma-70 factor (ECF subfamily)